MSHVIVAEGLSKTYRSGGRPLPVLQDVNLVVEREERVAILGPSGSGKTTLLGLLAGLDTPTRGRVVLEGQDLSRLSEDGRAAFRARNVGFVFQSFHLLPSLTALENVLVPLEILGEGRARERRERAVALLERVGLGDRLHHYPLQLSGGEQQRVALARAFSTRPRLLFADEPTGNLDQRTGETVIELLDELHREAASTLVMVTHDLMLAERTPRVIRLQDGHVVADECRDGALRA
ncbi:MAG: ABC transporter ATP-binding protein [Longimicrobiales bacterium]|nr:ABC transporter ATP-binding protein [Longimicrobiales bacterium]